MKGNDAIRKAEIRHSIKELKRNVSDSDKCRFADMAFSLLERIPIFSYAERILCYYSLPDELPTLAFLTKWQKRKSLFLPRVNGMNLDILKYDEQRLQKGAFLIEEPVGEDLVPINTIQLVIVPGVAFDRNGNRLGRGKGFYDRLLAGSSALKVGICYPFQLIDDIPSESHDVRMDVIITDTEVLDFQNK